MYLKLAGLIESQLRDAYSARHEERGLTQADIARRLEVDRATVHDRLSGRVNMTIESIANMVWALDYDIDVKVFDPHIRTDSSNYFVLDDEVEEASLDASTSPSEDKYEIEFETVAIR